MITSIVNPLGYDRFHLIDLENGQLLIASQFQLDKIQECVMDFEEELDFPEAQEPNETELCAIPVQNPTVEATPSPTVSPARPTTARFQQVSTARFQQVTEAELEALAAKRLSEIGENTTAQTKWSPCGE